MLPTLRRLSPATPAAPTGLLVASRPGRSGEPPDYGHHPAAQETAKKDQHRSSHCLLRGWFTAPGTDIPIAVPGDGVAAWQCRSGHRGGTTACSASQPEPLLVPARPLGDPPCHGPLPEPPDGRAAYGTTRARPPHGLHREPGRTGNRRTDCHRMPGGLPGPPVCPARRFRGSRRGDAGSDRHYQPVKPAAASRRTTRPAPAGQARTRPALHAQRARRYPDSGDRSAGGLPPFRPHFGGNMPSADRCPCDMPA
jgi:hypothetical protein